MSDDSKETKFKDIGQSLRGALSLWQELSDKAPELSVDEKRLLEMKELMKSIQAKIQEMEL